jgi:hypothetical protein
MPPNSNWESRPTDSRHPPKHPINNLVGEVYRFLSAMNFTVRSVAPAEANCTYALLCCVRAHAITLAGARFCFNSLAMKRM